jgi:hypothetical protein
VPATDLITVARTRAVVTATGRTASPPASNNDSRTLEVEVPVAAGTGSSSRSSASAAGAPTAGPEGIAAGEGAEDGAGGVSGLGLGSEGKVVGSGDGIACVEPRRSDEPSSCTAHVAVAPTTSIAATADT